MIYNVKNTFFNTDDNYLEVYCVHKTGKYII